MDMWLVLLLLLLDLALDFDFEIEELEDVGISRGQLAGYEDSQSACSALMTCTTSAVPSSEASSPELAVGPAAVGNTLVNCQYTSTKHGLDYI